MNDVSGNELSDVWMAEFRGFFFGEGHLGITRNGHRNGNEEYTARAQITLRDDDLPVLLEIHSRLGGTMHFEKRGKTSKSEGKEFRTKPYAVWRTRGRVDVARVCDILELGLLPSKKRVEIQVMREFLSTVGVNPGKKGPAAKLVFQGIVLRRKELATEMRRLHSYAK